MFKYRIHCIVYAIYNICIIVDDAMTQAISYSVIRRYGLIIFYSNHVLEYIV